VIIPAVSVCAESCDVLSSSVHRKTRQEWPSNVSSEVRFHPPLWRNQSPGPHPLARPKGTGVPHPNLCAKESPIDDIGLQEADRLDASLMNHPPARSQGHRDTVLRSRIKCNWIGCSGPPPAGLSRDSSHWH
jgi:hypothetical protein